MPQEKLVIALKELELVQEQVNKYDDLSAKIKTWGISLWVASLGWYFQTVNDSVIILNIIALLVLWALDIVNKNYREDYRARREEVSAGLERFFSRDVWPANFSSPRSPQHEAKKILKYLFKLHISLYYLPLILISVAIYFLS